MRSLHVGHCLVRHETDPFQRNVFAEYAERWARVIPRCGGDLIGYFLPYEGTSSVAWALIGFESLAAYETYRAKLRADPDGQRNLVYMDSLATALAAAVGHNQRPVAELTSEPRSALPKHSVREVLAFIDANLDRDLRLRDLAAVGGVGISRFKVLFRQATGVSAHQYLIRRRVDRAAMLLRTGKLPIGRVALETGFCHQSHLAMHMRRLLGVSPAELKRGAPHLALFILPSNSDSG